MNLHFYVHCKFHWQNLKISVMLKSSSSTRYVLPIQKSWCNLRILFLLITSNILFSGSKYTQTVERVSQLIRNSPTDIKIRAVHCFAGLISVDKDPAAPKSGPIDHRVTLMTREWFRTLDAKSSATLLEMCKSPFPDIRQASFVLLDAVTQHQWGEELVARTAGINSFLLYEKCLFYNNTCNT